MKKFFSFFYKLIDSLFTRLGFGMRGKLISLFVVIKVLPLILLALLAWQQTWHLGSELIVRTKDLTQKANEALIESNRIAVNDAVLALDNSARENIERMTTDTAKHVASFLYHRDADILYVTSLTPNIKEYDEFLKHKTRKVVKPGEWVLSPDKKNWQPLNKDDQDNKIKSSNPQNDRNFNYRTPIAFEYEDRPLYLEMSFINLDGQEIIKTTTTSRVSSELKDITKKENTYAKAENYFEELKKLKNDEIYVSEVIGTYVPSKIIGIYNPENAEKKGIAFEPEKAAYAGKENPVGERFKGIIRWASPVEENGKIIGYVTLALDYDHVLEYTDHITPAQERYTELPDAYEGNYAFIWDYKGKSISHPRHHSIVGYHPETGEAQTPWLEDKIYYRWQESGLALADFLKDEPTFVEQSREKKPSPELTNEGLVGLDCRYLNNAPQCTGWFDLTSQGGSGSFNILWSGLDKLTTAATIPYYTGRYADSPRGFGFVAIGAELEDFHRPAQETGSVLNELMEKTKAELDFIYNESQNIISDSLTSTTISISTSTILLTLFVIFIAIWMASVFTNSIMYIIKGISNFRNGERQFRFNAKRNDEIGDLCNSFDKMADTVVNSVHGTLVITDTEQKIIYANDQFLQSFNLVLENIVGKPYEVYSIFGKNNPIHCLLEACECQICFYEPTQCYYRGEAEEYKNENGKLIGYTVITTDISSMIIEQKQIEEQRAILSTVFSSSSDFLWYKNTLDKFVIANLRFADLCNTKLENIIGKSPQDVLPHDMVENAKIYEQNVMDYAIHIRSEETYTFADGHSEIVDVMRTPIFNSEKELIGILGISRDITLRVNIEKELRKTQEHLEDAVKDANKANEAKSAFLARMSHEIRTPMNAVLGISSIAKRKLCNENVIIPEIKKHVEQIESSAQHLLGLINEILEISKIEAGKIELEYEQFNLNKLIQDVIAIIDPRCLEKNINFTISIDKEVQNFYSNDALRLRQIIINILSNAIKFTTDHGVISLEVKLLEKRDNLHLIFFSIADTGIGIDKDFLPILFSPFEQSSQEITKKYGGTGLGLFISQSMVELMGGKIQVESTIGEGSTFFFSIWMEEVQQNKDENKVIDHSQLKGKRVLIVDDVEINRLIVKEIISTLDMQSDEAVDGEDALDKYCSSQEGYYDLILMDVLMPKMDGYKTSKRIRTLTRSDCNIPIIALTANSFKDDIDKTLESGMDAHIAKPIEFEKLIGLIIELCT